MLIIDSGSGYSVGKEALIGACKARMQRPGFDRHNTRPGQSCDSLQEPGFLASRIIEVHLDPQFFMPAFH
jgi:cystathionine beta-lyase family protein involved in aluminum resistance